MNALLFAVLLVSTAAEASPDPMYHVDAGLELEGGGAVTSTAFRGQLLFGNSFFTGRVRPELAGGATLGAGDLYVPDPRAADSAVGLSMTTFGPEAQVALQFYDSHDEATTRLFASASYLRVHLDDRLMWDHIPGVGGSDGTRFAVGVNIARWIAEDLRDSPRASNALLYIILPQQAEFTSEDDGGSKRYGVTISWGS